MSTPNPLVTALGPVVLSIWTYTIMLVVTGILFILFMIMFVVSLIRYNKSVDKFSIGNSMIYSITLLLFATISYNLYMLKKIKLN
jgi:hypothetical protein